jgi:tryptophan-rich sensory protein
MSPARASSPWPSLLLWLLATLSAGAIGALATRDAPDFYQQLARPDWAPPASLFGPVWTLLYLMMGVSAWLIWRAQGRTAGRAPWLLFFTQLALNALWSWIFFAWRRGDYAFADILLLLALIIATIVAFWRLRPLAAVLLLPYLGWVSFATALTWSVWQRNPLLL